MRRGAAFAIAMVAMGLAPFAACGDSSPIAASDAEAPDAGRDSGKFEYDTTPEPEKDSGPTFNADGWIEIKFDPHIPCGIYAAPTKDKLPPPIEWESCDAVVTSTGLACRQIKPTWAPPTQTGASMMGPAQAGWVDEKGKAWLTISPRSGESAFGVVVEADGPVHQAIVYRLRDCFVNGSSLAGHHAVFTATRTDGVQVYRSGALGGDVDLVPALLESVKDGLSRAYYAGPDAYFALGPDNAVRRWTGGAPIAQIYPSDPGQSGDFVFAGDTLFFTVGNLSFHRIKVYAPGTGLRDFISFGNDVSANAADFGTDGTDMVWVEAFGSRTGESSPWTTINIMTAAYTADPTQIVKRRVRSEVNGLGAAPFTVGCGYAGHDLRPNGKRLVRLSDGRSWLFPAIGDAGVGLGFQQFLAITCDEIFMRAVDFKGHFQVVRIRLDSLGPGEPAD